MGEHILKIFEANFQTRMCVYVWALGLHMPGQENSLVQKNFLLNVFIFLVSCIFILFTDLVVNNYAF